MINIKFSTYIAWSRENKKKQEFYYKKCMSSILMYNQPFRSIDWYL